MYSAIATPIDVLPNTMINNGIMSPFV